MAPLINVPRINARGPAVPNDAAKDAESFVEDELVVFKI